MRRVTFTDNAWTDYTSWLSLDRHMLKRINRLIVEAQRDPFAGIGKPEPLRGQLAGFWSRRIDGEHRLVYAVTDSDITIIAARGHYDI